MTIGFSELSNKKFTRSMMGYDPVEVTNFVRDISLEIDKLLKERTMLKEMVRERDVSLLNYKEKDKALKDTLEVAKEMSKKLKSDTNREARLIINDAEQNAERIMAEAKDSLKDIYKEIITLKKSKIQIETNLRALLHAHLTLLDDQVTNAVANSEDNTDVENTSETSNYNEEATKASVSPISS